MTSAAYKVFERLEQQISSIRVAASKEIQSGQVETAPALLRSCIVLAVAAVDTYVHEQGVRLLRTRAQVGPVAAGEVATYLSLAKAKVTGDAAEGYIRLQLSYRTLTTPEKIDKLLKASGLLPEEIWLHAAMGMGTRPDRLRMQLQLQTDRRNQIAHEGDWDSIALDFRPLEDAHVKDCLNHVNGLINQFDLLLP